MPVCSTAIVERVGAAQLKGVNQAHEQVAHGIWSRARIENAVGTTQLTVSGNHGQPYLSGSKRTWRSAVRNFHFQNQFDSRPAKFSSQRMPCILAGIAHARSRRAITASEVTQPPSLSSPGKTGQLPLGFWVRKRNCWARSMSPTGAEPSARAE